MTTLAIILISASITSIACFGLWLLLRKERKEHDLKYSKLLGQKKSSEVLLGQVTEKLVPFLDEFAPHDPRQATFLGQPIDYLVFGTDEITFIEVKSGNAKLTTKQRAIKRLVQNGQVAWHEIKIK